MFAVLLLCVTLALLLDISHLGLIKEIIIIIILYNAKPDWDPARPGSYW